jgi:aminoglycoside phosphotransferase (APT) family kinase protein
MTAPVGEGREAEIRPWAEGRVVRLMWNPAVSEERLGAEAAVMRAVAEADVTVPMVHEQVVVDGRRGLVMDRITGPDLLTDLERHPWRLPARALLLGRLHARLHGVVAPAALPALHDVLRDRLGRADALPEARRLVLAAMLDDLPVGDRICHGDLHPGNVMVDDRGPVIIDWTNAARGDPMADLARTLLILRVGSVPGDPPFLARLADRFGRGLFRRLWVRGYAAEQPIDWPVLERWRTVWAGARLAEGLEDETDALLAIVEAGGDR